MAEPEPAAPGETIRPNDDPLVSLLRAVRMAADAASVMAAAVDVLAHRLAVAWIAADPDGDGRLEVMAVSGTGARAIEGVAGAVAAGVAPWRDACRAAGLDLAAWQPLDAASLPSAFLGLAVSAGETSPGLGEAATDAAPGRRDAATEAEPSRREAATDARGPAGHATDEIARFIGTMVDAHADRAAAEGLLATTGRLDWLEATRRASRAVRHDLANVLTGISFYGSQLVADLPPETASAADAAAIGDVVARGGRLLDVLLQLWRDPAEPEVVPLDPAAVVDAITRVLAVIAEPCPLQVGPLTSMVVRASRRMLEEALLALVVEAREAAAGVGSISVAVNAEVLPSGNALGLPAGTYSAIAVGGTAPAPPDGVASLAGDLSSAALMRPGQPGLAASLATIRPGEPGRAVALAALAARTAGGGLRLERWPGGGTRATILLPQASSRRRGTSDADEPPADG